MKSLLVLLTLTFTISVQAQNTWVQRLYFQNNNYAHDDDLTGVKDIQVGADGDIYVLARVNKDARELVFKIDQNDSVRKWYVLAGQHVGVGGTYSNNVYPTRDSGCIVSFNSWSSNGGFINGKAIKYSKFGDEEWATSFFSHIDGPPYYTMEAKYVCQNSFYNDYYLFVGDSLYKLDAAGNIVNKIDTVQKLFFKPDGDLLLQTSSGIFCTDTAGNINWYIPGDSLLSSFPNHLYILSGSFYQKINNADGSIIWSLPQWNLSQTNISQLDYLEDGGALGSCGIKPEFYSYGGLQVAGQLFKTDSAGNILWTKTFDFPFYGLSFVKQLPSGNIITGGAFIFTAIYPVSYNYERWYSAFVASLDSAGNGTLETTSRIWPGDANNNQYFSFVDDALNVMAALNDSGPKRDTLDGYLYQSKITFSDYAADWPNSYCNGVNHKYADFNGDGRIDTSDISLYDNAYPYTFTIPAWRKSNQNERNSSIPDFRLIPEKDSTSAGDSLNYYIVVGSTSTPVDSIYALAFLISAYYSQFVFNQPVCVAKPIVNYRNSSFGTPGTDVFTHNSNGEVLCCYANATLISRMDHLNLYNVHDTVGIVTVYTDPNHATDTLLLDIQEFKAITACGDEINFNVSSGSVVVSNRLMQVHEGLSNHLTIYPNPAKNSLTLNTRAGAKTISIYDSLGKPTKIFQSTDASVLISTGGLANGVYHLKAVADGWSGNSTFLVEH